MFTRIDMFMFVALLALPVAMLPLPAAPAWHRRATPQWKRKGKR
jgi:hypothetical protein